MLLLLDGLREDGKGMSRVVAHNYAFVHQDGNCHFSTGHSWRKTREERPLTSFISRWMPNGGSTRTVLLDMLGHDFECLQLGVVFFADLATALVQPLIQRRNAHLPRVCGTPDHLRVTGREHVPVALGGWLIHTSSRQHRALSVKSVCSRDGSPRPPP